MNIGNSVTGDADGGAPGDLVAKCGLGAADVAQVQALAAEVERADGVGLKLNLPRPEQGTRDRVSDLCCYGGGRLVGYAPLDEGGGGLEVTAAVLPSHRRRGVLRLLLDAARREARSRGAGRLLLVSYPASRSGAAAVRALGLPYVFSEYRLEADADTLPSLEAGRLRLAQAEQWNVTELARLRTLSFGGESKSPAMLLAELDAPGSRYFLAALDGEYIGQIGVVDVGDGLYLRGFGIVPARRRQGYGRQLLAAALRAMVAEGRRHFALDVATDNRQALLLYEACGFRQAESDDYHDVPLAGEEITGV